MILKMAFFLIIGVCTVAVAVWSRAGRSERARWWVGKSLTQFAALVALPVVGAYFILGSIIGMGGSDSLETVIGLLVIAMVIVAIWSAVMRRVPRWLFPRWYKTANKSSANARSQERNRMTLNTTPWQHSSGFAMPIPADWTHAEPDEPLVAVIALEPPVEGIDFRANIVVTIDDGHTGGFDQWQSEADQLLGRALNDWLLLDLERVTIDGHQGVRRLGHHATADNVPVVMEQWVALDGQTGYTVTFSVGAMAYDDLADQFAQLVGAISIPKLGAKP